MLLAVKDGRSPNKEPTGENEYFADDTTTVRLKPLRTHITPDDHFEEGMRLLAHALRVWELKRRWPGADNRPVSP